MNRVLYVLPLTVALVLLGIDPSSSDPSSTMPAIAQAFSVQPGEDWECWNEVVPGLCPGTILNDFGTVSENDVWAVGEDGTILHWNGLAWSRVPAPTHEFLTTIDMVSAKDGWAMGSNTILRWDGFGWANVPPPSGSLSPHSLEMVSSADGWAIDYDTFLHWDGISWTRLSGPVGVNSLDMIAANNGWAVGEGGKILHWDGTAWRDFPSPTNHGLSKVVMTATNDGWAYGRYEASPYPYSYENIFLRWNGIAWNQIASPVEYDEVLALSFSAPNDGWLTTAARQILHWNGSTWSDLGNPVGWTYPVKIVEAISPGNAWAVDQQTQAILHWDGHAWSLIVPGANETTPGASQTTLRAVDMLSSHDGWAVGDEIVYGDGSSTQSGIIFRWNGERWSKFNAITATDYLQSINMVSATDGWTVGRNGTVVHWDGQSWLQITSPVTNDLFAVDMVSASDGWIVGEDGVILHWDGRAWSQFSSPTTFGLLALDMVSATDGWAGGRAGITLHWNGNTWSSVANPIANPSPLTPFVTTMAFVSSTDGWAAGTGNGFFTLRWNGSAWTLFSWIGLCDIATVSGNNGWAVAGGGGCGSPASIMHWNGSTWSISQRLPLQLLAIDMVSADEGWAVGTGFVHYTSHTRVYLPNAAK